MKTTIACLILAIGLLPPRQAHAQSTAESNAIQAHNAYIMDSLQMEVLAVWSQGKIDSPQNYSRHKTRELGSLLQSISTLYDDSLTRTALFARLKRFHDGRLRVDTASLGGLALVTVYIDLEKFLRARLQFSCIGDYVVAQRYELQPVTLAWCSDHSQGFFDFNYCKTVYPDNINFPLRYSRQEFFYTVRLSPANRQAAAAAWPQYAPFLALDSSCGISARLLTDAYFPFNRDADHPGHPDLNFVNLVRAGNIPVLTGLLYCPNDYPAINALEAFIYLEATHQTSFTPALEQRIHQLKTTSALKTTDQQVIANYRTALAASAK